MLRLPPVPLPLRAIHNPLSQGKALLLGPSMTLLRWPKGEPVPEPGRHIEARMVVLPADQAEALRRLLFSKSAIERCDAAKSLPRSAVLEVYSYQQTNQLLYVAEHLSAEIRAHVATGPGIAASLHQLIAVAYGKSPEIQRRRWNAYASGGATAARAIV